jgi:hypothetical protein
MYKYAAIGLSAITLLLAGCSDSDDDNETTTEAMSNIQAVHASSDAPRADIWVNDSLALSNVDYGIGSGYLMLPSGQNSLQVDVQLGGGDSLTVVPKTVLDLSADTKYTVMVVGEADASSQYPVEPLIVTRDKQSSADASSLDVQIVHASAGVPEVDVYVTSPNDDLMSASPLATLSYKASTGVVNIPNGDYRVRLTISGTKDVAFDSGTITLAAMQDLTIAAIPNTNSAANSSPVKLLVLDGVESGIINGVGDAAQVRVGHLVSDAPTVDVGVNGNPAIQDLSFKNITPYVDFAADSYDLAVYADDMPMAVVIDAMGTNLAANEDYSIFAIDKLDTIEPLIVVDERRTVATSAVLNVTHAAPTPAASTVDVYLTPTADISMSDPAIENFAYKASLQGIYVPEGTYYVSVALPDTKTVAIGPVEVMLSAGVVYHAVAIDDPDGAGFDLLLTDISE